MNSMDHRYRRLVAVSVIAILCFVLILELFSDSDYKSVAILAALCCWFVAALVMILNVPRYLVHLLRDRLGVIGEVKPDDER